MKNPKPKYDLTPVAQFSLPMIKDNEMELPINLIDITRYLPVKDVEKTISSKTVKIGRVYSPMTSFPWHYKPEGKVSVKAALDYLAELAYDRVVSRISVFKGSCGNKPIFGLEMQDTSDSLVGIEVLP